MDYNKINKELDKACGLGVAKVVPGDNGGFVLRFRADNPSPLAIARAQGVIAKYQRVKWDYANARRVNEF